MTFDVCIDVWLFCRQ